MTKWQKSTMLAVVAACALAAPAQADDLPDAGEFTGETVAVQTTAETRETCRDPEVAPLLQGFKDKSLYFIGAGR